MRAYARRRVEELAAMGLSAYVLKSKSPSCGPGDVKVHGAGASSQTGTGLFAAALIERFPDLPIEDESRLADRETRIRFLERASAYGGLRPTRFVPVVRADKDGVRVTTDVAAAEEPLDIRLHGRSFAVIMRTPGEDRALAAGFLLSERIIRSADDIGAIEHCRHPDQTKAHHVVDVFLRGDAAARVPAMLESRRQVIANSSCGVCGRATIDELRADIAPLRRVVGRRRRDPSAAGPAARAAVHVRRNRRPARRRAVCAGRLAPRVRRRRRPPQRRRQGRSGSLLAGARGHPGLGSSW